MSAAVCAAAGAPSLLTAALGALACATVVESVLVRWAMGTMDGVLLAIGGILVAFVLLGTVLDVMPGRIGRIGWAVGAAVIESAVVLYVRPPRPVLGALRLPTRSFRYAWYGAGLALVIVGLVTSIAAEHRSEAAPVSLSVQSSPSSSLASIEITASSSAGPYTLVEEATATQRVLASAIYVVPNHPFLLRTPTAPGERITIRLLRGPPVGGTEIRRVILQAP